MKLKTTLFVLAMMYTFIGHTQTGNFDLSKYKLPKLDRKTLETEFNISGDKNHYRLPDDSQFFPIKRREDNYTGYLNLNYNRYINKPTLQRRSGSELTTYYDVTNTDQDNSPSIQMHSFLFRTNYYLENRKYFNNNLFFETDVDLAYKLYDTDISNINYSGNGVPYSNERNERTHDFHTYLPLMLGKGRIEMVNDARHAVYLADELTKVGRLSKSLSDDEIIEFAQLISVLKNKRFFDSRLRRISEIESLDSFLIENKYVEVQDARYFTTLTDFWLYGDNQVRYSGTRFSGGIEPGYSYQENKLTTSNTNAQEEHWRSYSSALILKGGFEMTREKPINLQWQNSLTLNGYANYFTGKAISRYDSDVKYKIHIPTIELNFDHMFGFYPNTRTDMSFGYSVGYIKVFDSTDEANEVVGTSGSGIKTSSQYIFNYYISPQLRLNIKSSIFYIWQDSNDHVNLFPWGNSDNLLTSLYQTIDEQPTEYFKSEEFSGALEIKLIYSIF